ncbi:MAG TPA: replication-associated recombination protein A [Fimbriimonas sp.]|nr:replication-associated recombination protein A [Fimbriimonas sp.]
MDSTKPAWDEGMPLAARMRPKSFDEFFGQGHLVGPSAAFRRAVEADRLGSVILWGPPGVGKTTLAEIVANVTHARFERVSAVTAGVADLRRIVDEAKLARAPKKPDPSDLFAEQSAPSKPNRTILFIDEIHRFNKAQQDAILPHVENGTVTLIGATTENPSFEVNAAILSRCRVFVLKALTEDEVRSVIERALNDPQRGYGRLELEISGEAEEALVGLANGDARSALNMLELCVSVAEAEASGNPAKVELPLLESAVQRRLLLYDKGGEQHFDLISALHKTVRGSDVDASLYWLARMLESGEDPLYLARRIVRMASEDIGLADPQALGLCIAAQQAVHFIGMPEGALALAEAVAYLAAAPKSNALYAAYGKARSDVEQTRNDPPPLHLRNAPTRLMKEIGYGEGYKYAQDYEGGIVYQQNLPDSIAGRSYYQPTNRGYEEVLAKRIAKIKAIYAAGEQNTERDSSE